MESRKKHIIFLLAIVCSAIYGCKKEKVSSEHFDAANIFVANLLPTAPNTVANFFLDSLKLNPAVLTYPSISATTTYMTVLTGNNRKAVFKNSTTQAEIASKDVTFEKGRSYSVFLAGTKAEPSVFFTEDTLVAPPPGKALIRLVHLSPALANIDLALKSEFPDKPPLTKIVLDGAYQSASKYMVVDTSANYTIQVLNAGTNTVRATGSKQVISAGRSYTLLARGIAGGSPGLTLQLFFNMPY
jgi:hypothetical protein